MQSRYRLSFILIAILVSSSVFGQQTAQNAEQTAAVPSRIEGALVTKAAPAVAASDENPEDFNSLSLVKSKLTAERPLSAGIEEKAKFTREIVQLKWRPGDIIEVYVIKPKGVSNPPVILYLYGYPADNQRFEMDSFAERVTEKGFAAVGFVGALNEARYKNRPMKEWFVSELQESLVTTTHDVQMILNYLDQRGDLDMEHVGMFGEGSGGTTAVLAAATDPRIKAVDLLDPWGDWPSWMAKSSIVPDEERAALTKPEFLSKVEPYDILRYLTAVKPRPVRLVQTKDDVNTPLESKKKIELAMPTTGQVITLESSQDLGGTFSGGNTFFDWVKEQVKPAPPAKPMTAASHGAATSAGATAQKK